MKIRTETPAPRADSVLDSQLSPEQAQAFADQLDRGLPLQEAADWLLDEHEIRLSRASISRWAARRRRARAQTTYAQLREMPPGQEVAAVIEANALLLNQMILAAGRNGDACTMMHASKVFSNLFGAVARTRRAETSRIAAETARRKFEFDAVKAALDHAEELRKIQHDCQGNERLRMAKAIYRMFGKVPLPPDPGEWEIYLAEVADQMEAEDLAAAAAAAAAQGGGQEAGAGESVDGAGEEGDAAAAAAVFPVEACPPWRPGLEAGGLGCPAASNGKPEDGTGAIPPGDRGGTYECPPGRADRR